MLNTGDRVKVYLPKKELTLSQAVRQFHGIETKISGQHFYTEGGGKRTYYLAGCVSDFGIPYEFLAEWLIPLDEESEGEDG